MGVEKVHLTKEKETLLLTLYAKALDSESPKSILHDRLAAEAVSRIDYDFKRLEVTGKDPTRVSARAAHLDIWTKQFLSRHTSATVVHLGCGLDTRFFRVDPQASVRWYDVDYPDVIDLRRRLYPTREGYHLIGSSLTELDWVEQIPRDQPAMIVAEGVFVYLAQRDVERMLDRLTSHFPSGELIFDAYNRFGVKMIMLHPGIKKTGARLGGWYIDDPRDFETKIAKLRLVDESVSYEPELRARFPLPVRGILNVFQRVGPLRRIARFLRYSF